MKDSIIKSGNNLKQFIMQIYIILLIVIIPIVLIWGIIKFIKSSKKPTYLIVFLVVLLGATLPFHYIPSKLMVFPKNNFTFSNTIITEEDINQIIKRYNSANIFEQTALNNEPLVRKLREVGVIVDKDKN